MGSLPVIPSANENPTFADRCLWCFSQVRRVSVYVLNGTNSLNTNEPCLSLWERWQCEALTERAILHLFTCALWISVCFIGFFCRTAPKPLRLVPLSWAIKEPKRSWLILYVRKRWFSALTVLLHQHSYINLLYTYHNFFLYGKSILLQLCSRVMLTDSSV